MASSILSPISPSPLFSLSVSRLLEAPVSFCWKAEQDPWILELQPHQMLGATNEPQNTKLNTQFTKKAALSQKLRRGSVVQTASCPESQ